MTKKKYADWNAELSRKLQDLREQKRNWGSETAALRLAEKELRVRTLLWAMTNTIDLDYRRNMWPKEIYWLKQNVESPNSGHPSKRRSTKLLV